MLQVYSIASLAFVVYGFSRALTLILICKRGSMVLKSPNLMVYDLDVDDYSPYG